MNELLFFGYIITVSFFAILALKISKEALISLICVQAILANLFVTKEIELFGFVATASDALSVGSTLSLNLLQEYWGKNLSMHAVWISFFSLIFYAVMTVFHLAYIPAEVNSNSVYFDKLLLSMPRLTIVSLLVYLFVQRLDCKLYSYLSNKLNYRHFIIRNYTSVAITQLIDTILFSFFGLWGINESFSNIYTILQIIVVSYIIKLCCIAVSTPFLSLSKKIINHE